MACFWTSLVGADQVCGSGGALDEFWANSTGDLQPSGSFEFWAAPAFYRMSVLRSPSGQVLSYAPSLALDLPVVTWVGGELAPENLPYLASEQAWTPGSNVWGLINKPPWTTTGIFTVKVVGSNTTLAVTFTNDTYSSHVYEVVWAG